MSDEAVTTGRPRAFETIVYGGLAIGILDFIDASTFFPLYFGITIQRVWQGVSAGLLGRDAALAGGWNTALLGMILHFVVAFCIATVYYFASRYISFMIRQPVVSGLIYGVIAHFVMQWVVIPLSAIGTRQPLVFNVPLINSIVGHALLVGLPVALIAAWSAKKNRESTP